MPTAENKAAVEMKPTEPKKTNAIKGRVMPLGSI
jgi:hypothetical protein